MSWEESTPSLLNHELRAEEVRQLYLILLSRAPESWDVIETHVEHGVTIAAFLAALLKGDEFADRFFERSRAAALRTAVERKRVDVLGTEKQIAALLARTREVWTRLGEVEPHWSVLTARNFRQSSFGPRAKTRFFALGVAGLEELTAALARCDVVLPAEGRVLDFGCGTGRLVEHLAPIFKGYVGVDISTSHLALAVERAEEVGARNAEFRRLPDFLDSDDTFELVYSLIVLQHNSPPIMAFLLETLLARVAPGGLAFFQVPAALPSYHFDLERYLADPPPEEMEMHALPQAEIHRLIADSGCQTLEMWEDGRIVPRSRSLAFLVRRPEERKP